MPNKLVLKFYKSRVFKNLYILKIQSLISTRERYLSTRERTRERERERERQRENERERDREREQDRERENEREKNEREREREICYILLHFPDM